MRKHLICLRKFGWHRANFGLARNRPFLDGNKRTAFVVSATFLILNGSHRN
jgi:hypothetical protein